jgi:hypothetical protein
MRRRPPAGPILTAAVGLALIVGGCGSGAHHTSSASASSSGSVSGSQSPPTAPGGSSSTSTSTGTGTSPAAPPTGTSTSPAAPPTGSSTTSGPAGPPPAPGSRLTVAPTDGHPTSTVRFTLVAPAASGKHGQAQLSYSLSVSGPQGSGCVAQHESAVDVRSAGQPVTVAVGPAQLGGRWCSGSYAARATELARPVCGPAQVCPQFIRVVAVIGPVRFKITG